MCVSLDSVETGWNIREFCDSFLIRPSGRRNYKSFFFSDKFHFGSRDRYTLKIFNLYSNSPSRRLAVSGLDERKNKKKSWN